MTSDEFLELVTCHYLLFTAFKGHPLTQGGSATFPPIPAMKIINWISDRWRQSYRFRIVLVVGLVLILTVLFFPYKTTTVPEWNLRIVDDGGTPVREINVTEHWQDYPLELSGNEEAKRTDSNGTARFDPRTIRASLARRLFARVTKPGDRAQTVPYGAIVVWGSKEHATTVAVYSGTEAPQPEIRVQRLR